MGAALIYRAFCKKHRVLGTFLSAGAAPIINTGLFILGALFMQQTLADNFVADGSSVLYFLIIGCAGINFIADKDLVRETRSRCDLTRGGVSRIQGSPYTEAERIERASRYLDEHAYLRVTDYMALTGLKRTKATLELQRLSADPASGITASGYGCHRVYMRRTAG